MSARVFVTGGSGFIGGALVAELVRRGVACVALARSDAAARIVTGLGAQAVRGELTDEAALVAGLAGCEVVYHVAGDTRWWVGRAALEAANVTGTATLLAAARQAGVRTFVHVSSEAVLMAARPLVAADETWPWPTGANGNYMDTKREAEQRVMQANSATLKTVSVRPPWVWGPHDTSNMPALIRTVRTGAFRWVGGGRYARSTCHVQNVCEGLLLAAEHGRGGEAYFVTDGEPVEFRAFFTRLMATQGVRVGDAELSYGLAWCLALACEGAWALLRLRTQPPLTLAQLRLGGRVTTVVDAKARRELGYRGLVSVEAGLQALEALGAQEAA